MIQTSGMINVKKKKKKKKLKYIYTASPRNTSAQEETNYQDSTPRFAQPSNQILPGRPATPIKLDTVARQLIE